MQIRWKTLFTKTITWLAVEICLNFLGLDNLADYEEFINSSFTLRYWPLVFSLSTSHLDPTNIGKQSQWIFSIN